MKTRCFNFNCNGIRYFDDVTNNVLDMVKNSRIHSSHNSSIHTDQTLYSLVTVKTNIIRNRYNWSV